MKYEDVFTDYFDIGRCVGDDIVRIVADHDSGDSPITAPIPKAARPFIEAVGIQLGNSVEICGEIESCQAFDNGG
jgi:hypothetical protein